MTDAFRTKVGENNGWRASNTTIADEFRIKAGEYNNVKKKKTFEKGFTQNWTEELFTIDKVKHKKPVTYTIEDTRGEEVHGTFYEPELQKTKQEVYRIEKVLKNAPKGTVSRRYM